MVNLKEILLDCLNYLESYSNVLESRHDEIDGDFYRDYSVFEKMNRVDNLQQQIRDYLNHDIGKRS